MRDERHGLAGLSQVGRVALPTQLANFTLAQARLRSTDFAPHVALLLVALGDSRQVVDCRTVDDVLNAASSCDDFELRVQLVLAEETTIGIVRADNSGFPTLRFELFRDENQIARQRDRSLHAGRPAARRLARDANCAWS